MMRRLLLSLATFTAAGCSSGAGVHANERADVVPRSIDTLPTKRADVVSRSDDSLHSVPLDAGLSGAWATGSSNEPTMPRIEFRLQCNFSPGFWALEQRGDTVRAWVIPESRAQGILSPIRTSPTPVEGRLEGGQLVMGDGTTGFRLRYDSASGHLRGTLNGAPFWAVRLDIVRPTGCVPVP